MDDNRFRRRGGDYWRRLVFQTRPHRRAEYQTAPVVRGGFDAVVTATGALNPV